MEIGCFEGNKAETLTLLPVIAQFQARHQIAGMVIVADAGMLSATNLHELDAAGLGFIVGSRTTKAPIDLESHYRWHGDYFTDGQIIDTITPRAGVNRDNDPALKAEPVWNPRTHTSSWRAVWAYSATRAVRDNKTLNAQEAKARAVIAGEKTPRTPRFVTVNGNARTLDEASLTRARKLVGLKGYVTNIPHNVINARGDRQLPRPVAHGAVLPHVQDRPRRPTHVPPHERRHRSAPDHRVHRLGRDPRSPGPHQARDPQRSPSAAPATFRDPRDQRRHADVPTPDRS